MDIVDDLRFTADDEDIELNASAANLLKKAAAEIDRLRSQPCPYVTGNVTRYCTLTPFTLTNAERGAIEAAIAYMAPVANYNSTARDTLRGLLERTSASDGNNR